MLKKSIKLTSILILLVFAFGLASCSKKSRITGLGVVPLEISDVSVSSIGNSNATIIWTTNKEANSLVEYGTSIGYGAYSTLSSNYVTNHSINLTGLAGGTLYHYRVISTDTENNQIASNDFTFTASGGTTNPPVISNVTAINITTNSATITWTTDKASTSQVEYGTTANYGSSTSIDTSLVTSHSVTLTGLTAGTPYHYRVRSKDSSNNETIGNDNVFTTSSGGTTLPVISGVSAGSITSTSAVITWTTDVPATSQVEYGTTTSYGILTTLDSTLLRNHSVNLTGLTASTLYHYRVRSKDSSNNEAIGTDNTFTTESSGGGGSSVLCDFESGTQGWVHQTWTDSQACTAVAQSSAQAKFGSYSLEMTMNLVGSDPEDHKTKGEAYVDIVDNPLEGVTAPVDLNGIEVSVWVYCPSGSSGDESMPNGVQVFFKDATWKNRYSTWVNLTPDDENTWIKITDTPSTATPPMGFQDAGFDPTQIRRVGVKMGAGGGSTATYSGSIYVDGLDW